jgi:rhamnogalacturonan endolyase
MDVVISKPTFTRGDVDGDGTVGISDVTALIDYILTGVATDINLDAADCDQNSEIGISDVTALIDYILTGNW